MKNNRQSMILDIIAKEHIETQEQLLEQLRQRGVASTQATISRDIKQLHLVKEPTGQGRYRYAVSVQKTKLNFADKLRTIFRVVLPSAVPGILSGIILSIGRIVGETAALIFTSGSVAKLANGLFSGGRTLAVHMYVLSGEGLYFNQAYATAVVLLVIVLIINMVSNMIAKRLTRSQHD